MSVLEQIKADEGLRLQVYDDATGKPIVAGSRVVGNPTIGYGTLLSAPGGLAQSEALSLAQSRVYSARQNAATIPVYAVLNAARRDVLVQMVYQMGLRGVLGFKRALAAMEARDWDAAARELLDSAWARQTPGRARRLAEVMRGGHT